MKTNETYWDLIAKETQGQLTPEEQQELQSWLASDPEHQKQYDDLKKLWSVTKETDDNWQPDANSAWQKFEKRISTQKETKVVQLPFRRRMLRVAAILLVALGLGWAGNYYFNNYNKIEIASLNDDLQTVVLPDGSKVFLNKDSRISYDKTFNPRTIELEGEAFFDVIKDPKPFKILTAKSQVEVLGTSFNVRAFPDEPTEEVVVKTGKVAFSNIENTNTKEILKAGEGAIWQKKNRTFQQEANPNAFSWKTKQLSFKDTPLNLVMKNLERHYGIDFEVENEAILNCRFTGDFTDATLDEIFQIMNYTTSIDVTGDQNEYTLSGKGCQ